jgi:hypothetical protein
MSELALLHESSRRTFCRERFLLAVIPGKEHAAEWLAD